jgi:large subunit ribosomal protein L9
VVEVARGYARNYLLPRGLAEAATAARVGELRKREEQLARREAKTEEQAREIANRLGQVTLRFDVKAGPTGSLFGSVTATDLVDGIWESAKVRIDRRKIDLAESIKRIGRFEGGGRIHSCSTGGGFCGRRHKLDAKSARFVHGLCGQRRGEPSGRCGILRRTHVRFPDQTWLCQPLRMRA